jgi:hypothetical protein
MNTWGVYNLQGKQEKALACHRKALSTWLDHAHMKSMMMPTMLRSVTSTLANATLKGTTTRSSEKLQYGQKLKIKSPMLNCLREYAVQSVLLFINWESLVRAKNIPLFYISEKTVSGKTRQAWLKLQTSWYNSFG